MQLAYYSPTNIIVWLHTTSHIGTFTTEQCMCVDRTFLQMFAKAQAWLPYKQVGESDACILRKTLGAKKKLHARFMFSQDDFLNTTLILNSQMTVNLIYS
jgi:hypothetical protein